MDNSLDFRMHFLKDLSISDTTMTQVNLKTVLFKDMHGWKVLFIYVLMQGNALR